MEAEEEEGDHCQCPKSLIALPPLRLSEAVNHSSTASTSHCYKCAGAYLSYTVKTILEIIGSKFNPMFTY